LKDIYQSVTDQILEWLDKGTVPWRTPITGAGGDGMPKNLISNKAYRGVNAFLLAITTWIKGYESSYWITYKQAREKGGHVRKGEKSTNVIFWKQHEIEDTKTNDKKIVPVLRHFNVFNIEQCEKIPVPDAPPPITEEFTPIEKAEAVVAGYRDGPTIEHGGGRAFYRPSIDGVRIPEPGRFENAESYYATLFHELVHSTGHSKRLDRGLDRDLRPFGSPDYSKEELVAEMGAAFLAAVAGISPPTIEQSAAYIDGWRSVLRADKKIVIQAAGQGQKAADWIRGDRPSTSGPTAD